ncbi:MAG TPA: LysE family transporter [Dongiaceae bacterium]|jgi:threonine/homoserine/homoserine lactone efflux protein|nr:LysE family transporter [Dongiaceae bacterium]
MPDFLYLKALLLGFGIVMPVGPITVLLVRRTLTAEHRVAVCSAAGIIAADSLYAFLAAYAFSSVVDILHAGERPIRLVGGAILLWMAVTIWRSVVHELSSVPSSRGAAADFASIFALTLSNPLTILGFAGVFATIGTSAGTRSGASLSFALGISSASLIWTFAIVAAALAMRHMISPRAMRRLNRASAIVLALFGLRSLIVAFTG